VKLLDRERILAGARPDEKERRNVGECDLADVHVREVVLRGLTFDMSGGRRQAKLAGGRPLDGRVRPHRATLAATRSAARFCGDALSLQHQMT